MSSRAHTPHIDSTPSSRSPHTPTPPTPSAPSPPSPPPGPRLRGRERQWVRLLHLLDTTRSGPRRGGVALVEGAAGTGRSRLLSDAAAVAAQCGFSVAYGTADEIRRAIPLAPLIAALDPTTDAGSPHEDPGAMGAHSAWLIDRMRLSLGERLRRGPVAVVLDDLQWADTMTLAALSTLVARSAGRPVVWVMARRTGGTESLPGKLFTVLGDADRAERLHLPPLDDQAVAELAADRLSAEPAPELLSYAKGADGNPAALIALLDGLVVEHHVRVTDGRARPTGELTNAQVPRRFSTLVRDRATALQPGTRLLLDVACVLGRTAPPEDIAQILGETTASMLPALREALESRIMVCEGDTVAFRHELVRQALLAALPGPLRGSLHRRAAEMVIGRDGGVLPAAAHLVHGARRGDTRAVTVLCAAATAVVATDPRTAAGLAQRALEITGPPHPVRADLVRVAVEALARCGPLPRAITLAEEALGGVLPKEQAAVVRCQLSSALLLAGRTARAVAVAGAPPPPGTTGAEELTDRIVLGRLNALVDLDAAAAEHETRQEMTRHGRPSAGLRCVLARSHWYAGRVGEALRQAREAAGPPDGEHGVCWPFPPRLALATMLTHLRETTEAAAVLSPLRGDSGAEGWPVLRGAGMILGSSLALARGALEEAESQAAGGLAAADEAGMPRYSPLAWRTLTEVALRRGDLAAADGHVRQLTRTVAEQGLDGAAAAASRAGAAWMTAQLAAARRDLEGLDSALATVHTDHSTLRLLLCEEPAAAAWLVRTATDRGDGERADATVRAARRLAADNPDVPSLLAAAAHAQGVHRQDADALRRAVQTHRDPWCGASAAEDLGALCAADRATTVTELEWAMAKYARLGAARDEARVRRRLRRLGVRRRHWKHADRPASGWASLTDTERRVADLVAQGLTNRQVANQMFLSSHTVGFHLRQIYRKLRLRSRIDLARTHPGADDGPGPRVTDRPAPQPGAGSVPSPRDPASRGPETPRGPALPDPRHPTDTT